MHFPGGNDIQVMEATSAYLSRRECPARDAARPKGQAAPNSIFQSDCHSPAMNSGSCARLTDGRADGRTGGWVDGWTGVRVDSERDRDRDGGGDT